MDLKDKVLLITGSSRESSMGAATARLAFKRGAKVVIHGRTESDSLKSIAKELNTIYVTCDVTDKQAVNNAVKRVIEETGRIDTLINCAGIAGAKPFLESEDEFWLGHYKTNVLGIVHMCQAVIPHMLKQGSGRIVNIASIRGHDVTSSNRGTSYSASKAAVVNLTATLAKEYAPTISVNGVSPGFVKTDMTKTWNETVWNQVKTSLLERVGKPSELAEAILFLASDNASFMTGQTILVDGGYTISGK